MNQKQPKNKTENSRQVDITKLEIDVHSPDFPKKILNEYENLCYTASGKRGLSAYQVADIICQDNPAILKEKELIEILKAWDTDRSELKNYRRRERLANKVVISE